MSRNIKQNFSAVTNLLGFAAMCQYVLGGRFDRPPSEKLKSKNAAIRGGGCHRSSPRSDHCMNACGCIMNAYEQPIIPVPNI